METKQQNLEYYRSFDGKVIRRDGACANKRIRIDLNEPAKFPDLEHGATELRVVIMEGAYVNCNECNDKVELVLLDTAKPCVDTDYVETLKKECLLRERTGERGKGSGSFHTELFRYSEKPDVATVFKSVDESIADHPETVSVRLIDGAYIPDNYDRDLFKVVVRLEK